MIVYCGGVWWWCSVLGGVCVGVRCYFVLCIAMWLLHVCYFGVLVLHRIVDIRCCFNSNWIWC